MNSSSVSSFVYESATAGTDPEILKVASVLMASFVSSEGMLFSADALPIIQVDEGVIQLDTFSIGNGTELASNMDSTNVELRDRNLRITPKDILQFTQTRLEKYVKECPLPSEIQQHPFAKQYITELMRQLAANVFRSFETDAGLELLKAGLELLIGTPFREQLHLHSFGRSNHLPYSNSETALISPWQQYMRNQRDIEPTHLVLPNGLTYTGFVQKRPLTTVGFKGGNNNALVRTVSIGQYFTMPQGVNEITVYDVHQDRWATIKRSSFDTALREGELRYEAETKAPTTTVKRKRLNQSSVTDFYQRNPSLVIPELGNDIRRDEGAILLIGKIRMDLLRNYPELKDEQFTETVLFFREMMDNGGALPLTSDDKTQLRALASGGRLIDIETYLASPVGKRLLRVPFYDALVYYENHPSEVPPTFTSRHYVAKKFIDDLCRVAIENDIKYIFQLEYMEAFDRYPVQNQLIQKFLSPTIQYRRIYLQNPVRRRPPPGGLPNVVNDSVLFTTTFASNCITDQGPLGDLINPLTMRNGVFKVAEAFVGRGALAMSLVNNALGKISMDQSGEVADGSSKNFSLMPFVSDGENEYTPDALDDTRTYDFDSGELDGGSPPAHFDRPFPMGQPIERLPPTETVNIRQLVNQHSSVVTDDQLDMLASRGKAVFLAYSANGFTNDFSYLGEPTKKVIQEHLGELLENREQILTTIYNAWMTNVHNTSSFDTRKLIWATFLATYHIPRELNHYKLDSSISLAYVSNLLRVTMEQYLNKPTETDHTVARHYDLVNGESKLLTYLMKLDKMVRQRLPTATATTPTPASLGDRIDFSLPLGAPAAVKSADSDSNNYQLWKKFGDDGDRTAAGSYWSTAYATINFPGKLGFTTLKPYVNVLMILIASVGQQMFPEYNGPKLLILQPNVEFLMASGIMFRAGMMTGGFVTSGLTATIYKEGFTQTMLRMVGRGKTYVADKRAVITMEDIRFVKYLAGGGVKVAASDQSVFDDNNRRLDGGADLLVIPVPKDFDTDNIHDPIEVTIDGKTIKHYQGFQVTDGVITECKGHLRGGASMPGARAVMDGLEYQFKEPNYNDLLKTIQ